ncbi:hypothetical protein COX67_02185 [Candidatus Falkowbacteria bacterium CG_4_10_14_0_2_um_filter_36_22]|uniref:Methyltransferase type 11 domain-containing protein n=2 Tax=Candidatus Falkowiibacteriota TaxID=1752728 RepID=A0A1J4T6M4_9BACT|nr:MAG: hypothetical protein AUJ27_04095 [Candidatus Falkowbacteria bacterium CG1_02_37_44]PIV50776.1 MAG: hypothetical protein COS18_04040 [Candidatus Falkowbacteria bacterium CG02_land_8_20_14_3_00_36_14]PIX12164.1 MAG: hypothetical protein COZ73_00825 [Candidatus Falkowbacteria bacterium CG_4_8_14_3_um_filter_36_11]PJA10984.1 MAG: hypothetical protein COX67_02185 [Candidatus Falkowbacteria bacterium CG_4_10_14_0_2_um_filter_36_22]
MKINTMIDNYDPQKLKGRFDKESIHWQKLYQQNDNKDRIYNNKKYRQQYVLEILGPGSGKVLDLGCGAGSFFEHLEGLGYEVTGVDFSPEMVKLAASAAGNLKRSRAVQGDVLNLPFESRTFDALIAVGLLEYLPNDESFLKIVGNFVKPGGKIIVTLRNSLCAERKLWKFYQKLGINVNKADYFYREHNPAHFKLFLESLGFKNINIRFCHFYPMPWPLSSFFSSLNNYLAHKMERRFSNSENKFLGSTCIVKFEVPF